MSDKRPSTVRFEMWWVGIGAGVGAILAGFNLPSQIGWVLLAVSASNACYVWRLYRKTTPTNSPNDPAPNRRWFRATGYPVFEAFIGLLLLMAAIAAIVILPIIQWFRA